MAFTSSIDDVWITGGIVSGEPENKHYLNRLFHTEAILQAVIASLPGIVTLDLVNCLPLTH